MCASSAYECSDAIDELVLGVQFDGSAALMASRVQMSMWYDFQIRPRYMLVVLIHDYAASTRPSSAMACCYREEELRRKRANGSRTDYSEDATLSR